MQTPELDPVAHVRRVEVGLWSLAMLLVALALGMLAWGSNPPAPPASPTVPVGPPSALPVRPAPGPDLAAAIVEGNIFSSARRAPAQRYAPDAGEDAALGAAAEMLEAPLDVPFDAPAAPEEGVPRLYGTVVGAGGATALMRLDAASPDAQVFREGDQAGGFEVIKINPQSVVLRGPAGRLEVRLSTPEGATQ